MCKQQVRELEVDGGFGGAVMLCKSSSAPWNTMVEDRTLYHLGTQYSDWNMLGVGESELSSR